MDSSPSRVAIGDPSIVTSKDRLYSGVDKPQLIRPNFEGVPPALRIEKRWGLWRQERRDNQWTKVPLNACGVRRNEDGSIEHYRAKTNRVGDWTTWDKLISAWDKRPGDFDGIGFLLDNGFIGIDLDNCRDRESGKLSPEAMRIIEEFSSYSEVSPSGTGVKIFCKGKMPRRWQGKGWKRKLDDSQVIEVYPAGRYFAVTGSPVMGLTTKIESKVVDRTPHLERFLAEHFPHPETQRAVVTAATSAERYEALSDNDIIDFITAKATNASIGAALWRGDTSAHGGDDSAADLALANLIAFYTGPDHGRIARIFSMSGLNRQKWDRADYRQATIDKALEGRTEIYSTGSEPLLSAAFPDGQLPKAGNTPSQKLGAIPTIVQEPAQFRDVVAATLEAIAAKNTPPSLFMHGDYLARIGTGEGGKYAHPLTEPQLQLYLSEVANFVKESVNKKGEVSEKAEWPRRDLVRGISHMRSWPNVPKLIGVTDVPVFTRAFGLLRKPGYDAASGMYLLESSALEVPEVSESPGPSEIAKAKSLLLDNLLVDFPFYDAASRANALALFLIPFVRDLIDGPTPLHHIDAPTEGTGKGLLARSWGCVTLGELPQAITEPGNNQEWAKSLLATLSESPRVIYLDNLNGKLDSGALASALTEDSIKGRILGFTRNAVAPVRCVWVSTANNLRASSEIARRIVYVRLDANVDLSRGSRSFKYELPRWAKENRGKLVWACLTLCQAWYSVGQPKGRKLLPSYEEWSGVIDGILCHAGVTELLQNSASFRSNASESEDEWRAFVPMWWEEFADQPVTTAKLFAFAESKEMLLIARGVSDGVRSDDEQKQKTKLGNAIRKIAGKTFGLLKVDRDEDKDRTGAVRYRLREQRPLRQTEIVTESVGPTRPGEMFTLTL